MGKNLSIDKYLTVAAAEVITDKPVTSRTSTLVSVWDRQAESFTKVRTTSEIQDSFSHSDLVIKKPRDKEMSWSGYQIIAVDI